MTFRHYTSLERLPTIVAAGVITPTESNVDMLKEHAGPDVVWLLNGPIDDRSHGLTGSIHDKRAAFIEVDVPALRWFDWEWTHRMRPEWRDALIRQGGGPDAAARWYIWPAAIHRRRWVKIS